MAGVGLVAVAATVVFGDVDGNLARVRDVLAGVPDGPALVVFPELCTSGYVFADAAEARQLATTVDDARWDAVAAAVPEGAVAVVGFCESAGGRLFNSALVLTRDGVLGCYRKSHLWAVEREVFTPGDEAGAVMDTPIGTLGVAICYDNEFPEVPRQLALRGAQVLALPVNWPLVDRPAGSLPPETIQAMAAARSSRLPTVIADRHGSERGVVWTGGTAVVSQDGWVCATPDEHGIAAATVALHHDKSLGAYNDLFGDRRPDLYDRENHLSSERGIHA